MIFISISNTTCIYILDKNVVIGVIGNQ